MLHSISADNKFFERPTTPGAPVDGVYPDTPAPDRPGLGTLVKVQLYRSRSDLPDLALDNGGLWTYSWDDDASTSAVVFGVDDGTGTIDWSDPVWSTQSLDVMAGLPDELAIANERLTDVESEVAGLPSGGGVGGSQILTQEAGGYPGKVGTGSAIWVGKDKPPIGNGYAGGDDLYFQTSSI